MDKSLCPPVFPCQFSIWSRLATSLHFNVGWDGPKSLPHRPAHLLNVILLKLEWEVDCPLVERT
eukprot:5141766-Prorocentrum_lima.AAC.1